MIPEFTSELRNIASNCQNSPKFSGNLIMNILLLSMKFVQKKNVSMICKTRNARPAEKVRKWRIDNISRWKSMSNIYRSVRFAQSWLIDDGWKDPKANGMIQKSYSFCRESFQNWHAKKSKIFKSMSSAYSRWMLMIFILIDSGLMSLYCTLWMSR